MPSQRDDCLFCEIVREGTYVAKTKGFVAINDINPQAEVHILIIPEHHVDTFRDIGEFSAKRDQADARVRRRDGSQTPGLTDYRVIANVGPSAGQTVFHLHWHILGGGPAHEHLPAAMPRRR